MTAITVLPPTDQDHAELHFAAGVPGFPAARSFSVKPWGTKPSPFFLLECHEVIGLRFVAVPPAVFFPWYEPWLALRLPGGGRQGPDDVRLLVILKVHSTAEKSRQPARPAGGQLHHGPGPPGRPVRLGPLPRHTDSQPSLVLPSSGTCAARSGGGPAARLPAHRPGKEREVLVLTRHVHQSIVIGHDVVVTVLEVQGDQVRLGITAPKESRSTAKRCSPPSRPPTGRLPPPPRPPLSSRR